MRLFDQRQKRLTNGLFSNPELAHILVAIFIIELGTLPYYCLGFNKGSYNWGNCDRPKTTQRANNHFCQRNLTNLAATHPKSQRCFTVHGNLQLGTSIRILQSGYFGAFRQGSAPSLPHWLMPVRGHLFHLQASAHYPHDANFSCKLQSLNEFTGTWSSYDKSIMLVQRSKTGFYAKDGRLLDQKTISVPWTRISWRRPPSASYWITHPLSIIATYR